MVGRIIRSTYQSTFRSPHDGPWSAVVEFRDGTTRRITFEPDENYVVIVEGAEIFVEVT